MKFWNSFVHKNKLVPALVLLFVVLTFAVSGSFAAYTSIKTAKRVVSTVPSSDVLFSSNYLALYDKTAMASGIAYTPLSIDLKEDEEHNLSHLFVSVCNYAQGYVTRWCESDIAYDITMVLVDKEGNPITSGGSYEYVDEDGETQIIPGADILSGVYRVTCDGENEKSFQLANGQFICRYANQILNSEVASRDLYDIILDSEYTHLVDVKVEAITNSNTEAYALDGLGGILTAHFVTGEVAVNWSGTFVDAGNGYGTDTRKLSGFNYEITGNGVADYVLEWDSEHLLISEIFLAQMDAYLDKDKMVKDTNGNVKRIVFRVGEEGEPDSFSIQFYRAVKQSETEDWNEINGYIRTSRLVQEED